MGPLPDGFSSIAWAAAALLALLLGGAAAAWLLWRRRRLQRLAEKAAELDLSFSANVAEGLPEDPDLGERDFELWHNAYWQRTVELFGHRDGLAVRVMDLRGNPFGTFGEGELLLTAVAVTGLGASLPKVLIVPRYRITRWAKGRHEPNIRFDEDFSQRNRVVAADEAAARRLLAPSVRGRLANNGGWTIDVAGDGVIAYRFDQVIPPRRVPAAVEETVTLARLLEAQTLRHA